MSFPLGQTEARTRKKRGRLPIGKRPRQPRNRLYLDAWQDKTAGLGLTTKRMARRTWIITSDARAAPITLVLFRAEKTVAARSPGILIGIRTFIVHAQVFSAVVSVVTFRDGADIESGYEDIPVRSDRIAERVRGVPGAHPVGVSVRRNLRSLVITAIAIGVGVEFFHRRPGGPIIGADGRQYVSVGTDRAAQGVR